MKIMIYPDKLKKGDSVGITAVSATSNAQKIDLAIDNIMSLGLNVVETDNVRKDEGIVSSSGKQRAEELLELYKDTNVKYIIAARGGEFLMEMLPYLDEHQDVIRNNPKWFQGFSDPSLLNLYITTKFNIATIHMENISDYAMNPRYKSIQDCIDFMFSNDEELIQESYPKYQKSEYDEGNTKGYNLTEENVYECDTNDVEFEGRIIGGCIDTFSLISGTKMDNINNFISQFDEGIIWYIDNCELQPLEFYRRLWHMDQMGYFKNVKGFLIGRSMMQENNNDYYFSFKDAVKRALDKYNVPIVYNVDLGHIPPQMTIINGSYAKFHYKDGKGKLIQKLI